MRIGDSVFLSHTSDMAAYPPGRSFVRAAIDAALRAHFRPVDMEHFAARQESPAEYCQARVRECDIYLAIIGFRYGSLVPDWVDPVSYTELEFITATECGLPRLVFLLDEPGRVPRRMVDRNRTAIDGFRQRLLDAGLIVRRVTSPADLGESVLHALYELRLTEPARSAGPRAVVGPPGTASRTGAEAPALAAIDAPMEPAQDEDTDPAGRRPRRPWMAPPLDRIVERPELGERILAALREERPTQVGLVGAGGFGKTRLAAWACHQTEIEQRYPGGLLWVTVGQEASGTVLAERVNDLSFVLSGRRPTVADPEAAGGELGRLLDERAAVLLVIDDVWTESQLHPFLFGGRTCGRLVTTRIPDLLGGSATRIRVDAMSAEQARQLVTDRVTGLSRESADALAAIAGAWPVLLNLVNGVLRRRTERGETPERAAFWILRRLRAAGPAALDPAGAARAPTGSAGRATAVSATVEASLNLLSTDDQQRYLDLAVFPEDVEIPLDMVGLLWGSDDPDPLCEELVRLGLVADYKLDLPGPRLVLHSVLRAYLNGRLPPAGRAVLHRRLLAAAAAEELPALAGAVTGAAGRVPAGAAAPATAPDRGVVPWWVMPADANYLWRFVPYHLAAADATEELQALVCDLRWAEAKTRAFGSAVGVEADLALVDTPVGRALSRVLRQSAGLLGPVDPPEALAAILASRLVGVRELAGVREAYRSVLDRPYLEPIQVMPDQPVSTPPAGTDIVLPAQRGESEQSGAPPADDSTGEPTAGGHSGTVTSCAFSPDGALFATASDDRTVRLWNVADWSEHRVLSGSGGGIWCCAFSPDGMLLAGACDDGTLWLWNVADGTEHAVLRGHSEWVTSCAFSPDGTVLASTSDDRTARLWNVADGTEHAVLTGHTEWINGCAFSPDGMLFATASDDRTVRLWNVADGTEHAVLTGHTADVRACAFSPDGALLATAGRDQTVRLWRLATGTEEQVLTDDVAWMSGCAFSPDGTLLVGTGSEGMVRLWQLPGLAEREPLVADTGWITSCAFTGDGTLLAATSSEGGARVWRMPEAVTETTFASDHRRVNACAIAPDGTLLAAAGSDGAVRLLRPAARAGGDPPEPAGTPEPAWTLVGELNGHVGGIRGCVFSPDGALLATAADDRTARLWRTDGSGPPTVLAGHAGRVTSASFSGDGTLLATSGNDRTVRLWRMPGGTPVATWTSSARVTSCAFSPVDDLLATTDDEGRVRLWRTADAAEQAALEGHTNWLNGCAFSPDGALLATGGDDRTARLWRVPEATARAVLTGHDGWVQGCAFAPDGALLATVARNGVVRVWDLEDLSTVCAFRVAGALFGVAWHPGGVLLALAGGAGVYMLALRR